MCHNYSTPLSFQHQVPLLQPTALSPRCFARVYSVNSFSCTSLLCPTPPHHTVLKALRYPATPVSASLTDEYKHVFVQQKGKGGESDELAGQTTGCQRGVPAFYSTLCDCRAQEQFALLKRRLPSSRWR